MTLWIKQHKFLATIAALVVVVVLVALILRVQRLEAEALTPPIQRGSIVESVYGIGTVKATRSFQLKTGVGTTVQRLYVEEGNAVKRGQPLVTLSSVGTFAAPFDLSLIHI